MDSDGSALGAPASSGRRGGWVDRITRWADRIPDATVLIVGLAGFVLILSAIGAGAGWSAPASSAGATRIVNLLAAEHAAKLFTGMLDNFRSYPPVAFGVGVFLAMGIANRSGCLPTALGALLRAMPRAWLTPAVVGVCVCGNVITDTGSFFLIPLAASLYAAAGRHPLVGLAAAFAGHTGALFANIFIAPADPLIFGITEAAARIAAPDWRANILGNWYIMAVWAVVLTGLGVWITERIVAPQFEAPGDTGPVTPEPRGELSPPERRGLWAASLVGGAWCVALVAMTTTDGVLRGSDGSLTPFYGSMIALVILVGATVGIAYGVVAGTITSARDVVRFATEEVRELAPFLVLCFLSAQFLAWFTDSRLGALLATTLADAAAAAALPRWLLLLLTVTVSFGFELIVISASAKWAMMAPVVVPALMGLGISPEAATAAFRIGDSAGGIVTPINPLMPLVVALARQHQPNFSVGMLITLMLPYAIAFLLSGVTILLVFNALDLPLGPGAIIAYAP